MTIEADAGVGGNPSLRHALYYASLGWSVIPSHKAVRLPNGSTACTCEQGSACISKGKHPATGWKKFQKEPASEAQIKQWFNGAYADYGVGIITGSVSNMFVVDIDEGPGKQGGDTIRDLQMINGDLPHTVVAKTGGGGRHIIMKHPGGGKWIATAKNVLGPGVDIRGDGGFIVAAPSIHESGRFYLWDEHAHPQNVSIADAPEWIVEGAAGTPSEHSHSDAPATGTGEIIRDAWGKVIDGRERHMIGIICGVIAKRLQDRGELPSAEWVFEEAWPTYERTTKARSESLDSDNRGRALLRQRIDHMLRRAASGKWRPAARQAANDFDGEPGGQDDQSPNDEAPQPSADVFKTLDIDSLFRLPPVQWLIDGILTTDGFSVTYGPPGSLKTFLVLDQALHICSGRPWHGRAVRSGKILYVAGEGVRGIARRVKAWCVKHNVNHGTLPFRLLPASVNLSDTDDVRKLIRTAVAQMEEDGECVALVVVDTVARSIPGMDENSAQDMGKFVAAVESIKAGIGCHLLGVHHSGKDDTRGARGSSALLGAVDTMVRVKRSKNHLTVTIEKQKDDDEGPAIMLQTQPVEWMDGLKTDKSLVLVPAEATASEVGNDFMAKAITAAMILRKATDKRLSANKLCIAMGISGPAKQDFINAIPSYPDYITLTLGDSDNTYRLNIVTEGIGKTATKAITLYDIK